ncbi:hypothetical protein ACIHEI_35895 [Kitasatospora sp. NPDC051984]|uniref:phage tail tube protein n=1 Tax=Kitasatospora sp. NPDC051984 TaxID=3364059 RepID=UPI0037C66215
MAIAVAVYYGTDKGLDSKGLLSIPTRPAAQNRALMIAAVHGTKAVVWHYPKTSIIGADSVTMAPAALGEMPVKATVVALNQSAPLGTVAPVFDLDVGLQAAA